MKSRLITAFIVLCVGIALSGWFGPWYAPAVFVLVCCAILVLRTGQAIWLGLTSGLLVYVVMALIMLNRDDGEIIRKTGNLLGGLSPIMMVLVTALIGGATGIVAAWMGSALGQYIRNSTA